ncbi:cytochrome c peroxidase [Pseudooceanicola sp.]|uniref:cytochrome-c peroxidase n=1 Tax=Pseudooceanicola sp. TaxID=1914328 RepID=UPI002631C243|nr:cytochrome c peroxidase [Pseudooceanicola sp.]MDF1854129.1 cytochrome c peroxidase [Pseudooceanicola sp.]
MLRVWVTAGILSLLAVLSQAADALDAVTHSEFPPTDMELALLGRDLFFDPLLSGNLNISCATCHQPSLGTADAVSLSLGEGALALGADRHAGARNPPQARIPRNAPALFNLGAYEFTTLFHDGRTQTDPTAPFGIRMPPGRALERPLPSVLAAQALLPLQSRDEMAGNPGENAIADAVAAERIGGPDGAWALVAARVASNPIYAERFAALIGPRDLHITDIARALAEFSGYEFRSTDSPFDAYLGGDRTALSPQQKRGLALFEDKAGCSGCHSGRYQTDHEFHALALPQFGPGKDADGYSDTGRYYVTGLEEDRYRFRTPSLRNVALTAPYGHNGAYATLAGIVRHHLDPVAGLAGFDRSQVRLPAAPEGADDWRVMEDFDEVMRIAESAEITPVQLSDGEIADILAFLAALTDPAAGKGRLGAPTRVPSGLPIDR